MSKTRYARMELIEGPVELWFPDQLSQEDVDDIEALFEIILRQYKRLAVTDDYSI